MKDWRSASRARKFVARPKAASAPVEVSITGLGRVRRAFRLALLAGTCLAPFGAHAQFASDTWKAAPTNGQYNNAANWVGGNIPASSSVGTLYTATFGTSLTTTIAVAAPSPPELYVGSFQFNAGASAYTFNVADGTNLRFHGAGIVNNSSNAPTFNLDGSSSNLWLGSAAKAGNAIINITNGGDLLLGDTASAENAVINVTGSNSAGIEMFGGTLGDATVTLSGDGSTGLVLRQTASGGSARVIANGGSINIVNLTGAGTTLGSLAGASTSFNVNLGSKQLTVGGNNDSTSFAGRLNGSGGSIGKAGTGTWTLTNGTHTYDGLTTISGGTLALSGNGNLANSSGIALTNSGTTFDISAANGNRTIKDLSGVAGSAVVLGTRTLSVGTANDTIFAGDISGTGGLTKQGSGTLTLSGSNAYTGATTITDGTLALSGSGNIGASSGVDLTGATARFDISASGGSTAIKSLAGVAGSTVNLGANSLAVGNASSTTFAGVIDGSGGLIKQGTGTQTLTAASTYTGATQINGGTLALSGDGSIALSNSLTLDGTGASTVFDISQTSGGASVGSLLDLPSGPPLASTAVVRLGSKTLTVTGMSEFFGAIADGGIADGAGGGLTIAGVGGAAITAILRGTNTYTGATTIGENATLSLSGSGSIAASSGLDLSGAGATFDISASSGNQTIQDLSGVGGALVVLGGNSLTVGSANSTTFDGVIDGSGGMTKRGSGILTLTGTNTYTGVTTINAGTLALTNIDAIQDSIKVTVAAGAFFDLSGVTGYAKVRTIDGGGTVQLGDSGLEITNGSTEFSGVITSTSGSGGLTIAGGELTLSGVSTYSSLTTLLQGATLALKGAGSIANSSSIDFQPAAAGYATFDISQVATSASVSALVETRSAIGVVALGSKELVLTGTTTDFLGTITDGGIGGGVGGKLTLAADAGAILGGINTYTGATTINAGATLKLVGSGSIEQSSEVSLTGATATFDISGIGAGGTSVRSLVGNGTVQLGGNTLLVSAASGEFAGKIDDGGSGGNLVVTGGTLVLSGQSSYAGGTLIGQGATLALKGAGSIEDSMEIDFDPTGPGVATFDISQTTSGARVQTLLDVAGTGVIELGEKILTVTVGGDFFGVIKGGNGSGLTVGAGASLGLWGANTYTGATIVGDNAILSLDGNGSIASSSSLNLSGDNSIFDISCACTSSSVSVQNLTGSSTSTVILGANDLTVVSSVNTIFAGVIDNGGGDGGLIKQGAATLTLSGTNTYAGGTTINEGAISISSDANLGGAAGVLVFGGGTLKTTADITMSRATTLNIGGGTFDVATGTKLEHDGTIDGDGGLTKTGDGTLTLRGINTYAGETVINAGTLALSNGDISASSKVIVSTGATFDVSDNIGTVITALVGEGRVKLGSSAGLVIVNASGEFSGTITSELCGCSTLAIAGGTQTLSGVNSYAGITALAAGATLALKGSGSIAHSTGVEFFPFGPGFATFDISQTTVGATVLGLADLGGVGVVSLGSKTLTVGANGGPFAGVIQDGGLGGGTGGGLSVASPGFGLQLAGGNTYTGVTTILAGGLLAIVGPGSIAASSGVVLAGAGATFDISGDDDDQSQTIKDLSGVIGTTVALGGNSLTAGTANSTSFAGVIADGGYYGGAGGSLIKQGNGTLTLLGASTYTGGTTVNAGTLQLGAGGSLASGGALTVTGGTFDLNGNSQTVGALSGTGGAIALGGGTLTTDSASNTTLASAISGSGKLVKQGSGTLTLTGTNTYSGGTTVLGGTLIGSTSSLQGDIANNSTVVFDQATIGTYSGVMSGSGTLTKAGAGTLILTENNTYTGTTTITGGILQLGNGGTSGAIVGNVAVNGAESMLAFNRSDDVTFGGDISGDGSVMLMGPGKVTLTGTNSYTGGTVVGGGVVRVADDAAFGAAAGKLVVAAGATVQALASFSSDRAVELRLGGGVFDSNGNTLTLQGPITGSGALTKTGAGTLILTGANGYTGGTMVEQGTLQGTTSGLQGNIVNNAAVMFDQAGNGSYTGVLSGTGSLTKTGAGTVTLTGANSYIGGTTVNGGVLQLGTGGSLAAGSVLTVNGGAFDLNGNNQTVGALSGSGGTIALGSGTLTANSAGNATLASVISGSGSFVKQGSGTLALTGASTYTGGTTVNEGTLQLGAGGALASGGALTVNGGAFDLNGGSQSVGALSGSGGTIALGGGTLTTNSASNTVLASAITGSGSFVKQGSGTLILTGANSYTGGTTVSGGILQGNTAALQGSIVNNATVVFNQATNGTYAGAMSGNGALVKTGTGNLTLTGANSYTGGTTVSDGTLTGNTTSLQGNIVNNATVVFDQGVSDGATLSNNARLLSGSGSILGPNANGDTGNGTPVNTGAGTLTLAGTNTYSGATTVSSGTLTLAGTNTYSGATTVSSGTLTLAGTNTYSGGTTVSSGTLTLAGTNTYSGTTTVSSGTLTLTGSNVFATGTNGLLGLLSSIYAGAMSGSGALVKTGNGNLTLTGPNSYTGGTTVSGGILIGTTSSLQGGIVNNATVAFDQGANGTYDGAMSGSGALLKGGAGNVILTGANSYTGGTTVFQGTLTGTTSSLQGNIVNNATVAFDQTANGTYTGAMSGTGSLVKTGAGALMLTGTNSYSGTTTVNAGTLVGNTTSLQGNILNNAAVVFDQASNGVYAGALSGSGTLTKIGAGLLNLTGTNVVGGGTTVSGGTLAVNGSLTSNVTVGAGGAIGGTGTVVGALSIGGGTLAPGNSIGTLNVTGNFTQTGGVYQVEANAGGQSDKIVATGTATIGGGTTVQVLAASGIYQRSTTYTILSATGGLTGTYGGVTSNLAFLTPSLSYDANNAFLTLELLQNAFSFGGLTPNQRAVGRTLDTAFSAATGDFATVLTAMMGLSAAQGPAVLDTISGQPYASFGTVNVLANLLFMNTVGQQVALARSGGPGATRVALAEACEVACEMQEPPRWGAWFSGLGGAGNVGGNYNAGGLTYNLGGAAVGVDYRFDPRFLVGLAFGYSSGRQWVSGFQGLGTTDNYSAVLYASFTQGGFYADALAGYAYSDNRQQRVMQIPGLSTRYANGGAGANQFLGQIEAGYKIGFGLTETAQASVTPFARFQTVAASQKGFSEWGADSLNLNVQQQNTTSIRTVLGADLAANLPLGSERTLGVTLRLGWAHDYGDTARPMTAAFAGAPTVPFTIVGAQPMRDSAVVGFGLSTKITDSISAYARYDGELNGRDDNHNFSAGFRMTW